MKFDYRFGMKTLGCFLIAQIVVDHFQHTGSLPAGANFPDVATFFVVYLIMAVILEFVLPQSTQGTKE